MQAQDIELYLSQFGQELVNLGVQRPLRVLLIGGAYIEKDIDDCRLLLPQTKVKTRQQALRLLERYILPSARTQNAGQIEHALDELFGTP
jgi:hypothetical protein